MFAPCRTARSLFTLLILVAISFELNAAGVAARQDSAAGARQVESRAASAPREFIVTVTDMKGSFVGGLVRGSFTASDGKGRREIVSLGSADVPSAVYILIDTSGSIFGDERAARRAARVQEIKAALTTFLENSNPGDEYFVTAFNQRPQILLEGSTEPSAVLATLDRLAAASLKGQTALYDALYLALNRLARAERAKRVVLLLSDGQDNVSAYTLPELRRALRESDALVYTVATRNSPDDSFLAYTGYGILDELAKTSGGVSYYPRDGKQLSAVMAGIAAELRSQYRIAVAPAADARGDGSTQLKFKLGEIRDARGKKIKAELRAREAFYGAALPPK